MKLSRTYRVFSLVLCVFFALSTIGVPVVVASCPMKMHSTQPCCARDNSLQHEKISSLVDRSCCRTIIAGERNTTEFIRLQHAAASALAAVPAVTIAVVAPVEPLVDFAARRLATPPPVDIPVFTSSLLI